MKKAREKVIENLEYYIDKTLKSIEMSKGTPYYARNKDEALKILRDIIGSGKVIVKSKSMVTEEIGVREYLEKLGNEVWETDLGELLVQIANEKPMHPIIPAIHIPRERAVELLKKVGLKLKPNDPIELIVSKVREFLREKFAKADIGISGANVMAADTGAIVLVENEGNIRNSTNLPLTHIAIVGVEKIVATYYEAVLQSMVQSAYAGIYPPTYLSVITGPSSTADIEGYRVYGVHGPKQLHVILYDGGRVAAFRKEPLNKQLLCIKLSLIHI